VKVEFAPEARRQIAAFAAWWDDHRKDARVRVEDALEAAVGALAEHPGLGRTFASSSYSTTGSRSCAAPAASPGSYPIARYALRRFSSIRFRTGTLASR
jgi:plasmid stabilization system protein ParE